MKTFKKKACKSLNYEIWGGLCIFNGPKRAHRINASLAACRAPLVVQAPLPVSQSVSIIKESDNSAYFMELWEN